MERISELRSLLQFSQGETSFQAQRLLWKSGTNGLNVCEVTLLHQSFKLFCTIFTLLSVRLEKYYLFGIL